MKILIIQTAFIGDVVLATPIVEKLKKFYPDCTIDFVVRKGNEDLLFRHPHIRQLFVFDKKKKKYRNLINLIKMVRKEKYDYVINVQRFLTTGLLTVLSGAKNKIGFNKNPLSFLFSQRVVHRISGEHEIKRNLSLVEKLTDASLVLPKLYPSAEDFEKIKPTEPYICISPASVWFTKQLPVNKWLLLVNNLQEKFTIYLMGSKYDLELCTFIKQIANSKKVEVLAGKLTLLESAALMKNATMNYVNDSAPLHFASALNAPVTALFCSTIPEFGFGPLSDQSYVLQTDEKLACKPCGLHGKKTCPKGHFKCGDIKVQKMEGTILGR